MAAQPFAGVLVPVLTPFTPAGEPDPGRFVAFCRFLLDQGADGLAIFGTTSEANSMSAGERMALLDRLVAAGVPPSRLMPGAGACSITEAATLIRHAVGHGCGGVLMLRLARSRPRLLIAEVAVNCSDEVCAGNRFSNIL